MRGTGRSTASPTTQATSTTKKKHLCANIRSSRRSINVKSHAEKLKHNLDVLEAERLILTVELRNALVKEAKRLLPLAIRQASRKKNPSPALLRLITRLAVRPLQ